MSLCYPWQQAPAASELREIAPGVRWLRLPLPFALDHVNVWLLDTPAGTLIIDTGINTAETQAIWRSVLAQLSAPAAGLLITHYHPDHLGLSGWLLEQQGMPVWFSAADLAYAREAFTISDTGFAEAQDSWYRLHGLDTQRRAAMRSAGNSYRKAVHSLAEAPLLLADGDRWGGSGPRWQVLTVAGHAPEMICLHCAELNILIAADQLLPDITPNVSLNHYTRDDNPLASFLGSLQRFSELPQDILVLPSHGLPFRGLHERIGQLREHHQQRFARLISACRHGASAADMLPVLFQRELDYQQLMFAMGESVAHLRYLEREGRLQETRDKQGRLRYLTAAQHC